MPGKAPVTASSQLIGVGELAMLLETSRQAVQELTHRDGFPKPALRLPTGDLWRRELVDRWIAEHDGGLAT
jgi:predicted DNA-binding transcriptional regulator AlpA